MTRVIVLGAGPAGLGAALELATAGVDVTVVERQGTVGGNAGSFELAGMRVDYGSHRLHPAADPAVLDLIRRLLGDDLLERPRHGRIRLLGRWIHFPLRPLDLVLRMHPRFALGVAFDLARKLRGANGPPAEETFATVLERGLGATICREFYFPYARKIWGLEPEDISPVQAYKRVSAGSLGKLVRRLLPGGAGGGARTPKGKFLYPRQGYGQICERLGAAARAAGARVLLHATVARVRARPGARPEVEVERGGQTEVLSADHVWSTIPVPLLARLLDPPAPEDVLTAARRLETRALLLVYLVLETDRFSEYDAHYFPEQELLFSRVSEPKNYAALSEPRGRTVLCAEIPCNTADPIFRLDEKSLGERVRDGLAQAGLPVQSPVLEVAVRRLPNAYPRYRRGFEAHFDRIDRWLDGIDGLLTFGRQGLFVHDNTHHALYMARAAAACLRPNGSFDRGAWARARAVFATHVVED